MGKLESKLDQVQEWYAKHQGEGLNLTTIDRALAKVSTNQAKIKKVKADLAKAQEERKSLIAALGDTLNAVKAARKAAEKKVEAAPATIASAKTPAKKPTPASKTTSTVKK